MSQTFSLRPGTLADSRTAFDLFRASLIDLGQRQGTNAITGGHDPAVIESLWADRQPLFDHLATTAEHFWIAERDGQPIGYARSILRTGVRQLTEFFVAPEGQASGAGRELLAHAFPAGGASRRIVIATTDTPAVALYLRAGVYPSFPVYHLWRDAEPISLPTNLTMEPVAETPEVLDTIAAIDQQIIGHRRDIDHSFLLNDRQGHLYRRGGQVVGYGYTGVRNGPFALLDSGDYPAVLAHAENLAADTKREFGVELPLINRQAVNHLLARRCRLEPFFEFMMSDGPLGRLENYIFTSPPFIL